MIAQQQLPLTAPKPTHRLFRALGRSGAEEPRFQGSQPTPEDRRHADSDVIAPGIPI
jgi:hypothetical protein